MFDTVDIKTLKSRGVRTKTPVQWSIMVGGLLMKSSQFMLRPEIFNLSPSPAAAKSLYLPSARVCFRRKNNNHDNYNALLSSSAVNHALVFSAPRQKLNNFIFSSAPQCLPHSFSSDNKINPFIVNKQHSVITVSNKFDETKKKLSKLLASLLLFAFLAFFTNPTLQASASHPTTSLSTFEITSSSTATKFEITLPSPIFETFEALVLVTLLLFTIPLSLALVSGFKYFLQLCETDKKSVLMLQVWF